MLSLSTTGGAGNDNLYLHLRHHRRIFETQLQALRLTLAKAELPVAAAQTPGRQADLLVP